MPLWQIFKRAGDKASRAACKMSTMIVEQKGQNYLYPHDFPNHWVAQQYLPDDLIGTRYYHYGDNKTEQAARTYWETRKKEK